MDDNKQQSSKFNPNTIYPEATKSPIAGSSDNYLNTSSEPQVVYVQQHNPVDTWSIILFVLLLLTFFSPLGPILFLPMVVVGIIAATRFISKSNKPQNITVDQAGRQIKTEQKRDPLYSALRIVAIVAITLVLGFVGLIGVGFILLASSPRGFGS